MGLKSLVSRIAQRLLVRLSRGTAQVGKDERVIPSVEIWEFWEGTSPEILDEALAAIREDLEEQSEGIADVFRNSN